MASGSTAWRVHAKSMPRVKVSAAGPDRKPVEVAELRARWHTLFGRRPSFSLPRHLLFRVFAYRVQAAALGDLDRDCLRLLDHAGSSDANHKQGLGLKRVIVTLQQGAILSREWNGRVERVAVLAEGFAWNGKTYPSLSKVAIAITGTRWNGPRFFGLRDQSKPASDANP
jgi:Protein of unknown function (DUF2924)